MFPPLAATEPLIASPGAHWLRLSLPAEWHSSAVAAADWRNAFADRLQSIRPELQQFLMTYSAALVATAAFIA